MLYHLQQRQEQVLAVLDDELPEDDINGKKSSKPSFVTVPAVRLATVQCLCRNVLWRLLEAIQNQSHLLCDKNLLSEV